MLLTVPPDSRVNRSDPGAVEAITAEIEQKAPDLLTALDPARGPGMHATDSVDFDVVVSGRVILSLENGEAELQQGDCVVQRGTWHTWRNPCEEPCVLAVTMLRTDANPSTPPQRRPVRPHLTGNRIGVFTRFDNRLLPWFGLPPNAPTPIGSDRVRSASPV